jgi:serine protein kinase
LVGSENFVEIQRYGDTSHPLAWNFNGALFSGNRGITELIEIHKARADLLYPLLVLAEERKIKVDRFGLIDADEILIAHTNYTENTKFKSKKENEALIDRSREIEWRYNLVWDEEENIYKKMLGNPEFHLAPWTTKIIAGVAILSRLEQDKRNKKYDLLTSLKMYNNELQHLYNEAHFEDMQHENDGRFGISPRVAVDAISFASVGKECVSPIEALIKLKEVVTKANVEIRQGSLESLSELIQKEYDKFIKDLVFRAFIGTAFEKEAQTYFNKYIEHAFASVNNEKVRDPYSNKYVDFDEKFLRSIEEVIGISKEAAKDFRTKLLIKVSALKERGEVLRYDIHPELKNAIENKVFGDRSSLIRGSITSVVKTEENEKQIKDATKYLVENENFCETCAKEAIDYVAWLLDRIG